MYGQYIHNVKALLTHEITITICGNSYIMELNKEISDT
jgi:hypothetical protein